MSNPGVCAQAMGRSLSSGSAMEALAALGVWSAHEHLSLRRMGLTAVFAAELEVCTPLGPGLWGGCPPGAWQTGQKKRLSVFPEPSRSWLVTGSAGALL